MSHLKNSLDLLVRRLADNASLPKYQFERASEPLLSMFMEEWLSLKLGENLNTLTMEFPLKKEDSYGSTNADYLMASPRGIWCLVEVKTTAATLKLSQVMPYIKAAKKGRKTLIEEVKEIAGSPNASEKYQALLKRLDGGKGDDVRVIFVTPHQTMPRILADRSKVIWLPLDEFFNFESQHHPELWGCVRRLREGVWPNPSLQGTLRLSAARP